MLIWLEGNKIKMDSSFRWNDGGCGNKAGPTSFAYRGSSTRNSLPAVILAEAGIDVDLARKAGPGSPNVV
jgi:hypothetical protein